MDTFISVLLVGMAVGYITELLSSLLEMYIEPKTLKMWLTVPLSLGGLYLMLGTLTWQLAVLAPAAGFFALAVMAVVNRPVILQNVAQRMR
jgi:hypothetical protein